MVVCSACVGEGSFEATAGSRDAVRGGTSATLVGVPGASLAESREPEVLRVERGARERRALAELEPPGLTAGARVLLVGALVPDANAPRRGSNLVCVPPGDDPGGGGTGTVLRAGSWVGSPFEIAAPTRIEEVRVELRNTWRVSGSGFVALVPMEEGGNDPAIAPDLSDESTSRGHALFRLDPALPSHTARVAFGTDLEPGRYAVLVGTGAFGARLDDPDGRFIVRSYQERCELNVFGGVDQPRWWPVAGSYRVEVLGAPLDQVSLRLFAGDGAVTLEDWGRSDEVFGTLGTTGGREEFALDVSSHAANLSEVGASHLGVHLSAGRAFPGATIEGLRLRVVAPLLAAPPGAIVNSSRRATLRSEDGAAQVTNLGTLGSLSHATDILFGEPECPPEAPRYNRIRDECEPECPTAAPRYNADTGECETCLGTFDAELNACIGTCNEEGTLEAAGNNQPYTGAFNVGAGAGVLTFRYETYSVQDRLRVLQGGQEIFDSGCLGTRGWRETSIGLTGVGSEVLVKVEPNCAGGSSTAWKFEVACDGLGQPDEAPEDEEYEEPGRHGWGIRGGGISAQAWPGANRSVRGLSSWSAGQESYALVDVAGQLEVSRFIGIAEEGRALRVGSVIRNVTDRALELTFIEAFDPAGRECVSADAGADEHGASVFSYAASVEPAEEGAEANVTGSGESCDGDQQHIRMEQALSLRSGEHKYVEYLVAAGGSAFDFGTLPSVQTEPLGDEPSFHVVGTNVALVGGSIASIERRPWMVAIERGTSRAGPHEMKCGGALIAPDVLISSAHCFKLRDRSFRAVAGTIAPEVPFLGEPQRRDIDIEDVMLPCEDSDLAVVFLNQPFVFDPGVQPLELPTSDSSLDAPGASVEAIGWGWDLERYPMFLEAVDLEIVANDNAELWTTGAPVAAGGNASVCRGDSGGPLVDAERRVLLGTTWLGLDGPHDLGYDGQCGGTSIFTRVASFVDWIEQVMETRQWSRYCPWENAD